MKKIIIKKWLDDHNINLPDERIDLLIAMLASEDERQKKQNTKNSSKNILKDK
jgi:hypothetical protein